MFDDLGTMCLLGVFLVVGFMLLSRMMRGFGGQDYSQRGDEYPRYDDPDVDSRGGFGGTGGFGGNRPEYDDPDIKSRGSFGRGGFGRGGGFSFGGGRRSSSGGNRRSDSPNVKSRGGFGR
jgi:hypothetical protein